MSKAFRYREEPITEKYVIAFAPELIGLILRKEKIKTYRFSQKYDYLQVGDVVRIQNVDTKEIIGNAKILKKSQATFKDLPLNSYGHEKYKDKQEQLKTFSNYYAYLKRPIKENDLFLVFEFKLINN